MPTAPFLRAQPLVTGVEVAHIHTQGEQKSRVNMQQAELGTQCGRNKEQDCIYCLPGGIHLLCLEQFSSFHEPLDLQIPLLGRQTPKPLIRSNQQNTLNTEPELCVCIEALSSLALAPGVPICFPTPEDSNGAL